MSAILAIGKVSPLLAETGMNSLLTIGIVLFVIALIAYALGAKGVAGMSASLGKTLLFVFLVLAILFAVIGALR